MPDRTRASDETAGHLAGDQGAGTFDRREQARLSPSALNRFLGCEYRTYLDILERRGTLEAERRPPAMKLVMEQGERHEADVLQEMRDRGRDIVDLTMPKARRQERAEATLDAMRAGREVIYQGCLLNEEWVGYPDFLIRVDEPSALGAWSYEVFDAKLSRHAAPRHIFQLLFYNEELARLQGRAPALMHLILGDGERPSFASDDFAAYAERIKEAFLKRHADLQAGAQPAYPYPVSACEYCHWWHVCADKRRSEDHISLVAGLQRRQGIRLEREEIHDVPALAALPAERTIPRLKAETVEKLRAQASIQLRSRPLSVPLHELLPPEHGRGLSRLPALSPGDVHFDFEGDPYWGEEGLEYLFGSIYDHEGAPTYWPLWATTRAEEREALETWLDWIFKRLERFPDLHVYHYGSHETATLKALVARHATREYELDELLHRCVFVDLYSITVQSVRAGIERYGLKAVEQLYSFQRNPDLQNAIGSLGRWQSWQETHDQTLLDEIALYNRDDCLSTEALLSWLWARRPEAEAQFNLTLDELAPPATSAPGPRKAELARRTEQLRETLLAGLPDDESEDDPAQRARRLMFTLTGYHEREGKPAWWAYFSRREQSLEQLRDEDPDAIADLEEISREQVGRSWVWTLRYPPQDHKVEPGGADDPLAGRGVTVVSVDDDRGEIVLKRGTAGGEAPPRAVGPGGPYDVVKQQDAVFELACDIAECGLDRRGAGRDLLLRRPPRFQPGTPELKEGPVELERLIVQVRGLDDSVLVIQGPPGTGKTWTGARIALGLLEGGLRVGVMATAHKAIDNLLAALDDAADEIGTTFRGWRRPGGSTDCYSSARIHCKPSPDETEGPVRLHAATAWHWASPDARESVDVLLVDEAGMVSLADAIAVAQGTKSMVLLGDPQQLAHVAQGTHPLSSGVSVLQHLLGDHDTIPPDQGVLLDKSWRMHPDVCRFVSETMYDGRLTSEADCARQRVDSPGLSGTGLRMIHVEHEGNRGHAPEEAKRIAVEIERLLAGTYVDRSGHRRPLTLQDILVVTPYNAQVRCLRARLPDGARVGTVDKFQGQEAPIVFFSMAASSDEDISRGMSFLFSRNRLNVAISRAQATAVIVCSPRLLHAKCSTVADMQLVNMLCRAELNAPATEVRKSPCLSVGRPGRSSRPDGR